MNSNSNLQHNSGGKMKWQKNWWQKKSIGQGSEDCKNGPSFNERFPLCLEQIHNYTLNQVQMFGQFLKKVQIIVISSFNTLLAYSRSHLQPCK